MGTLHAFPGVRRSVTALNLTSKVNEGQHFQGRFLSASLRDRTARVDMNLQMGRFWFDRDAFVNFLVPNEVVTFYTQDLE